MIRSRCELTLRAAFGRLSRVYAALGSNPGGFVHYGVQLVIPTFVPGERFLREALSEMHL